jgi:hypothetical protein
LTEGCHGQQPKLKAGARTSARHRDRPDVLDLDGAIAERGADASSLAGEQHQPPGS